MRKLAREVVIFILLGSSALFSQNKLPQVQCHQTSVIFSLEAGGKFQQRLGELMFQVHPMAGGRGWMFSLENADGNDYFYPVNPPFHFNGLQTLGAGYGDTAKQSLAHGRELRFLVSKSDFVTFEPYVRRAVWPGDNDATRALNEYMDADDALHTGLCRLTILRADVAPDDTVRSADFKAEFIAPISFQFDTSLTPSPATCPASTLPIRERLPAKIPPSDHTKFQDVRDAQDWKNPYLIITRDGFDVRFQGERMSVPMSMLARTLVELPNSAWPYGRVIAAQENGVRGVGDDVAIRRNRDEAEKVLKELGLEVDWWPSA